jgi:ferredoxin
LNIFGNISRKNILPISQINHILVICLFSLVLIISLRLGAFARDIYEYIRLIKILGRYTMAMMITEDCISCDACLAECPNEAISAGKDIYLIDTGKCTECLGIADAPQCVDVCPANCIVNYPKRKDREQLIETKKKVHINW